MGFLLNRGFSGRIGDKIVIDFLTFHHNHFLRPKCKNTLKTDVHKLIVVWLKSVANRVPTRVLIQSGIHLCTFAKHFQGSHHGSLHGFPCWTEVPESNAASSRSEQLVTVRMRPSRKDI